MALRLLLLALVLVLLGAACGSESNDEAASAEAPVPEAAESSAPEQLPASTDTSEPGSAEQSDAPEPSAVAPPTAPLAAQYGPPPPSPTGPLDPALEAIIDDLYGNVTEGISRDAVAAIGQSGDPRLAWLVSDILRFIFTQRGVADLVSSFEEVTGTALTPEESAAGRSWLELTNRLIAWDVPEPPNYRRYKRQLFTAIEPRWDAFFADEAANIEWRWITWGGVLIDDRPLGDPNPWGTTNLC